MPSTYTPFQPNEQDIKLGTWGSGRDVSYEFSRAMILQTLGLSTGTVSINSRNVSYLGNGKYHMPAETVGQEITGTVKIGNETIKFTIPTYHSSDYSHNQIGSNGNDTIVGKVTGGGAHDFIIAGEGNDLVFAADGDDYVDGGKGDDRLYGQFGNDYIYDIYGNNELYGGQGNDRIIAGNGNDRVSGQEGKDVVTGGGGADNFVISASDAMDTFTDFKVSEGDHLTIANFLFSAKKSSVEASITDFVCARTVGQDTIISIDADGKGAGKFVDVALLQNVKGVDVEVWHNKGLIDIS